MKCLVVNIFFVSELFTILSLCFCDFVDIYRNNEIDDLKTENLTIFKKCCPIHQGLSRLKTNQSSFNYYECTDAIDENENIIFNTTLKYPLASIKLINSKAKLMISFPTQCPVEDYIEDRLNSLKKLPKDSCMDKIFSEITPESSTVGDGSFVVLSCKSQPNSEAVDLPRFRSISKCCVGDMVFDAESNICVTRNSNESYPDFFSTISNILPIDFDIINVKYGLNSCEKTEALFRYSSKNYVFKFYGNNLELKYESKRVLLGENSFCVDQTLDGDLVARSCRKQCDREVCITKCCPEGQVFMYPNNKCGSKAMCGLNHEWGFTPAFYNVTDMEKPIREENPDVLGIRYGDRCTSGKYILNPSNPKDKSYLNIDNGGIVLPELPNPTGHDFCMEVVDTPCPNRPKILYYFVCFPEPVVESASFSVKMRIYSVGLVISCFFLAATFMVYLFLPALQNLHGRIIMCYVVAMLFAFSCLARVQWPIMPDTMFCKTLGYAVFFSFMVAFSWLNIMCFDIWWTFGNTRSIQMTKQTAKELKKLMLFGLYAFGYPMILTTVVFLLDTYDIMEGVLDPNIGKSQCWFSTGTYKQPFMILFLLPAGIQISGNMVLFTLTAIHCSKVKSEIHRMQASSTGERCKRRFLADKAMFAMNMKLFIVMGISWTMEIISAVYPHIDELWYIPDVVNVLQGIPIFVILVLKKKVYRLLRKRLGLDKGIRHRNDASGVTSSTGISRTSCSEVLTKKHSSLIESSSVTLTNGK